MGMPRCMDDDASSAEHLYAERCRRMTAESRRLSLMAADVAEQLANTERHASAVHEALAASHPTDSRYADRADHSRRSAETAESFAAVEREVAAAENSTDARTIFEPYQPPRPPKGR